MTQVLFLSKFFHEFFTKLALYLIKSKDFKDALVGKFPEIEEV